jgi:hypothetical protein
MQDEPMMGIHKEVLGNPFHEFVFNLKDIFTRGKPCAIGDSENMGIHCNRWFAKGRIEDDIGGFASNARKCLKVGSVSGHFTAMVFKQYPAGLLQMLPLRPI